MTDDRDPFLTGLEAALAIVEYEAMRHELNAQRAKDDLTRCYAMQRAWTCRDLAAMIEGKALPLRPIVLTYRGPEDESPFGFEHPAGE